MQKKKSPLSRLCDEELFIKTAIDCFLLYDKTPIEQNTSKIKNQRLICKTTDLGEDAHTIFKVHI